MVDSLIPLSGGVWLLSRRLTVAAFSHRVGRRLRMAMMAAARPPVASDSESSHHLYASVACSVLSPSPLPLLAYAMQAGSSVAATRLPEGGHPWWLPV